jgi:hypothetical protein
VSHLKLVRDDEDESSAVHVGEASPDRALRRVLIAGAHGFLEFVRALDDLERLGSKTTAARWRRLVRENANLRPR